MIPIEIVSFYSSLSTSKSLLQFQSVQHSLVHWLGIVRSVEWQNSKTLPETFVDCISLLILVWDKRRRQRMLTQLSQWQRYCGKDLVSWFYYSFSFIIDMDITSFRLTDCNHFGCFVVQCWRLTCFVLRSCAMQSYFYMFSYICVRGVFVVISYLVTSIARMNNNQRTNLSNKSNTQTHTTNILTTVSAHDVETPCYRTVLLLRKQK